MLSLLFFVSLARADAGAEAARVAAMAAGNASERLDQLLAIHALSPDAHAALSALAPDLDARANRPTVAAAITLLLTMPPSEIGRARRGESVVRQSGEWKENEAEAVRSLAKLLGARGSIDTVSLRTEDAELVRVELLAGKKSWSAALAWPAEWTTPGVGLVDPSFENPRALGIAWEMREKPGSGAAAHLDSARAKAGATSLRLDAPGKATIEVEQTFLAEEGDHVTVLVSVAADGGSPSVTLRFRTENGGTFKSTQSTGGSGWTDYAVDTDAPAGTTAAILRLSVTGGGANFDNVHLSIGGVGGGTTVTAMGPIRVRHDGTLSLDVSNAAAITTRAITLLGLPPAKPVTLDHAKCPETAYCAVDKWIRRAWGPPLNDEVGRQVVLAATGDPSTLADVLKQDGAVALRQRWTGER